MQKFIDIIRKRGINRAVYFHTDIFEPWKNGINATTAKAVENFAKISAKAPYSSRLSLFYDPQPDFLLDPKICANFDGHTDAVIFRDRTVDQYRVTSPVIKALESEFQHELHVHIDQKKWIKNTSASTDELSQWTNNYSNEALDNIRFKNALGMALTEIETERGASLTNWAVIHGTLTLCPADTDFCTLNEKYSILKNAGCRGDFSYYSGGCDRKSAIAAPYCKVREALQQYNSLIHKSSVNAPGIPVVNLELAADTYPIWSHSGLVTTWSIDCYEPQMLEHLRNTEQVLRDWISQSPVINNTLYIRTLSHSLRAEYKLHEEGNYTPHHKPEVSKIFALLEEVFDLASIPLSYVHASDVLSDLEQIYSTNTKQDGQANMIPVQPIKPATTLIFSPDKDTFGEYCHPAFECTPRELEQFLLNTPSLKRLWLHSSPELDQVCQYFGLTETSLLKTSRIIDLSASIESLWFSLDQKRRNGIRSGKKSGVTVRLAKMDDLESFKHVWINGYCKKYGIDSSNCESDIGRWIETGKLFVALEGSNGRIIAGTLVRNGDFPNQDKVLVYSQNTSLPEYQNLKPNEVLIWHIVEWAQANGYRYFNFAGDTLFKSQFTKNVVIVKEWTTKEKQDLTMDTTMTNTPLYFRIPLLNNFERQDGNSWSCSSENFLLSLQAIIFHGADTNENPTNSRLQLYENFSPIGPAHASHSDIEQQGSGRYSHWKGTLYFSTSDNSDPNTNGRTYSLRLENPTLSGLPSAVHLPIRPPFVRNVNKCWIYDLGDILEKALALLTRGGDTNENPRGSNLRLFCGRKEFSPAHAPHSHIKQIGNGAFSHWHDSLYFSFPGNESSPYPKMGLEVAWYDELYLNNLEEKISNITLKFLDDELKVKGEALYQWYRLRFIPKRMGLSPWDLAIARFAYHLKDQYSHFVEIGAGIGQCSMLLAARKVNVLAIEASQEHYLQMSNLAGIVERQAAPLLGSYFSCRKLFFPDNAEQYINNKTLVFFTDLSWGLTDEQENEIRNVLTKAGGVILGLRYFFKSRDPLQQSELAQELSQLGFEEPVEVFKSDFEGWQDNFPANRIIYLKKRQI